MTDAEVEKVLWVEKIRWPLRFYLPIPAFYLVGAGLAYLGDAGLVSLFVPIPALLLLALPGYFDMTQRQWRLTDKAILMGFPHWPLLGTRRIPLTDVAGVAVVEGKFTEIAKREGVSPKSMYPSPWIRTAVLVHLVRGDRRGAHSFISTPHAEELFHRVLAAAKAAVQQREVQKCDEQQR